MRNFQDTFETRKQSFISIFLMNEWKRYLSSEKSKSVHKNGSNHSLMRLKMLNIKKNLWTIPKPQFFFQI